jgi:hypothetical protein
VLATDARAADDDRTNRDGRASANTGAVADVHPWTKDRTFTELDVMAHQRPASDLHERCEARAAVAIIPDAKNMQSSHGTSTTFPSLHRSPTMPCLLRRRCQPEWPISRRFVKWS